MSKTKIIKFRVEVPLFNTVKKFALEKGYATVSELMREVTTMHFMGIMLGTFKHEDFGKLMQEFLEKYKNSESNKITEKV
jgi:hypothetical protein